MTKYVFGDCVFGHLMCMDLVCRSMNMNDRSHFGSMRAKKMKRKLRVDASPAEQFSCLQDIPGLSAADAAK